MTADSNSSSTSTTATKSESPFAFTLQKTRGVARAGVIQTPHGMVETPVFMPVGTQASVKALDMEDVAGLGAEIQLANTYHLYLRPGVETLEAVGGIHQFNTWQKPVLTDSGGFQVWSLGQGSREGSNCLAKVSDEGVEFKSHLDGSTHFFTPERSIAIQQSIGADVIMAFDEAMSDTILFDVAEKSLARTTEWAKRCVTEWEKGGRRSTYGSYQALFGIIQGARYRQLREEAAASISQLPFDGIALGGETIGYNMPGTVEVMGWLESNLPINKPRYAMGLGRQPQDIIEAVLAGFDMFDCVGPTRLARNGALLVGKVDFSKGTPVFASKYTQSRLNIGRQEFMSDVAPIDSTCGCHTCSQGYSRAYLHHLFRSKELSYYRLASIHNLWTMIETARVMRRWILEQT